jgi:hypothetical protein
VWTYLGILVVLFLIVGAAFLLMRASDRLGEGAGTAPTVDPSAVGTSGERMPRERTPGGFDPAPGHDNTRSELEFRGAGEPPQGPMPGLSSGAAFKQISAFQRESAADVAGRPIDLSNVLVDRAEGDTFWVREADATAKVVAPGGLPTVRAGQRVDLTGTLERDDNGLRIRATRIAVK